MAQLDNALRQFNRADEERFAQEAAQQFHLPYVNLIGYPILPNTLKLVALEEAANYSVIPYLKVENKLKVALIKPSPEVLKFIQQLASRTGLEIYLALCSDTSFTYGLNMSIIESQKSHKKAKIALTLAQQRQAVQEIKSKEELDAKLQKASATQVLDLLFAAATGMDASDIHIEPQENDVRVRFRIDGVLQEVTNLTLVVYKQILSRVKFLAKIKLDVHRMNQDGRFTIDLASTTLDVRVSTLPSGYGEIIDMRLLRAHTQLIKLDDLDLAPYALAALKESITLPHGMILVTGPTGSGKTTTLYAVLDSLNKPGVKIISIEDPIEYRIDGIDQVQVSHEQGGLSFADALKGSLRQDPDILMVGEIRDRETAEVGLQAAMTGHLFLSTLHTNNAPASLSRLIDMGIEPYKIAGAINLIVAQRLVRKICANCHGAGCDVCHGTGYKGRMPIIEILKPSRVLDDAIMKKLPVRDLYQIALQQGMIPMYQDGMEKVAQGLTTASEVERVTAELQDTSV